jgi:membrane-bound ClpP family serine protease
MNTKNRIISAIFLLLGILSLGIALTISDIPSRELLKAFALIFWLLAFKVLKESIAAKTIKINSSIAKFKILKNKT